MKRPMKIRKNLTRHSAKHEILIQNRSLNSEISEGDFLNFLINR